MAKTKAQLLEENRLLQLSLKECRSALPSEERTYFEKHQETRVQYMIESMEARRLCADWKRKALQYESELAVARENCAAWREQADNFCNELISVYERLNSQRRRELVDSDYDELEVPHVVH